MIKKCDHENTPEFPNAIEEFSGSVGNQLISRRRCNICNNVVEAPPRPLPADYDKKGLDVFFDWNKEQWEPKSRHKAYEERRAKQAEEKPAKRTAKGARKKKATKAKTVAETKDHSDAKPETSSETKKE